MNAAGEITGTIIGLVWLLLGWWMIRLGAARSRAGSAWKPVPGVVVDKHGSTDGVILSHPYIRYAAPDGSEHVVPSRARGGVWEPGAAVDVLVDPEDSGRAMLMVHAERGSPYVVVGWFLVVVAVLTLLASLLLAVAVPR